VNDTRNVFQLVQRVCGDTSESDQERDNVVEVVQQPDESAQVEGSVEKKQRSSIVDKYLNDNHGDLESSRPDCLAAYERAAVAKIPEGQSLLNWWNTTSLVYGALSKQQSCSSAYLLPLQYANACLARQVVFLRIDGRICHRSRSMPFCFCEALAYSV
jgi:hypothetical protein